MAKAVKTIDWPADAPKRWPLARLRANPHNSKVHTEAQIEEIVASIRQWGWTQSILIDEDGMILAGHARVDAAKRLGLAEVPCVVAKGWTEVQKRAYLIADNRLGESAKWDDAMLRQEVQAIVENGFDLGLTGLSDGDLKRLNGGGDNVVVQEIAVSQVNDEFWISIRGPLNHQAEVLQKMKQATAKMAGVSVELGTILVD